ncbi:hypothetical protein NL108_014274 [Boleophthalmus pectinirostris]|nr:hypothetical protein NL108_014274 [Boleophthalmus pectinirostris]
MFEENLMDPNQNSGKGLVPRPKRSTGKTGFTLDPNAGSASEEIRTDSSLKSTYLNCLHHQSPMQNTCHERAAHMRFIFLFWLSDWLKSVLLSTCHQLLSNCSVNVLYKLVEVFMLMGYSHVTSAQESLEMNLSWRQVRVERGGGL